MGFSGVEAEPGLREHMFPGFQGGQRDRAMKVRPGADHHGVDVRIGHQVLPMLIGLGDAELSCRSGRRSRPAIAHCYDLDIFNCF